MKVCIISSIQFNGVSNEDYSHLPPSAPKRPHLSLVPAASRAAILGRNNILMRQNSQAFAIARGFRRSGAATPAATTPGGTQTPVPQAQGQVPIQMPVPQVVQPVVLQIQAPQPVVAAQPAAAIPINANPAPAAPAAAGGPVAIPIGNGGAAAAPAAVAIPIGNANANAAPAAAAPAAPANAAPANAPAPQAPAPAVAQPQAITLTIAPQQLGVVQLGALAQGIAQALPNALPQAQGNANGQVVAQPQPAPQVVILQPQPQPVVQQPQQAPVAPPQPEADPTECPTPQACNHNRFRCADILTRWGTAGFLDFWGEQYPAFGPGFCALCLGEFRVCRFVVCVGWCVPSRTTRRQRIPASSNVVFRSAH